MGRICKGVVTVGATYLPPGEGAPGAQGWRLDTSPVAGPGSPGSPCPEMPPHGGDFVHDLLDHWIPGFSFKGPVAEGRALVQLAARTGADPVPALQEVVDHLLWRRDAGREALAILLPADLRDRLPRVRRLDEEGLRRLRGELGEGVLRARLTARLLDLGWEGMAPARATWVGRGLDFSRRQCLARSLGRVQAWMERTVAAEGWSRAHGELAVASDMVRFRFDSPAPWEWAREVEAS